MGLGRAVTPRGRWGMCRIMRRVGWGRCGRWLNWRRSRRSRPLSLHKSLTRLLPPTPSRNTTKRWSACSIRPLVTSRMLRMVRRCMWVRRKFWGGVRWILMIQGWSRGMMLLWRSDWWLIDMGIYFFLLFICFSCYCYAFGCLFVICLIKINFLQVAWVPYYLIKIEFFKLK